MDARRGFLLLAIGLGLAARVAAQDKATPLDRADLDRRAAVAVYEATLLGTQIYNKGNHEGCYRLYQGTLMALQPMLEHRPQLAARVKESLERAATMRTPVEASFTLREALDAIQTETTGGKAVPVKPVVSRPDARKEPLWERLGGEKAVRAVVHDFVITAATDPKVNFTRGGRYPIDARGMDRLEQRLVEFISAAAGGPLTYTGKSMAEAHHGMGITDAEFAAAAEDLARSLRKFEIPKSASEELLTIVGGTKKSIVEKK